MGLFLTNALEAGASGRVSVIGPLGLKYIEVGPLGLKYIEIGLCYVSDCEKQWEIRWILFILRVHFLPRVNFSLLRKKSQFLQSTFEEYIRNEVHYGVC
uniref:Beta-galactosidase n=1 Tax=Cucumis sativus TaxID=3659 RepID=A0A0A0KPZ0_CUCSA